MHSVVRNHTMDYMVRGGGEKEGSIDQSQTLCSVGQ